MKIYRTGLYIIHCVSNITTKAASLRIELGNTNIFGAVQMCLRNPLNTFQNVMSFMMEQA